MPTIREVKTELRHREWAEQIQECQSSGMTVTAWCKEKGISQHTYYSRLNVVRKELLKRAELPLQQIVPLSVSQSITCTTAAVQTQCVADSAEPAERSERMLKDLTADNIYIVCGHTDMRKSIDGLAALIQQQFQLDLFTTNSAFLFCGRRRDRMKVLLWEDDGFLLLYKRLEDGKFSWPRNEQEVRNITREQFIWLTQGLSIDQPKAIKKVAGGVDIC